MRWRQRLNASVRRPTQANFRRSHSVGVSLAFTKAVVLLSLPSSLRAAKAAAPAGGLLLLLLCRSKERDRASADGFAATCGWISRCTAAQSTPCICGASPCQRGQTQGNNLPTRRSTAGRPFCSARSGRRKRRSGAFSGRRLPGPRLGSKRNDPVNPKQKC